MKVKKFYIETYGCQMNVTDSEVVAAILEDKGYQRTQEKSEADVILVNTCSVRENAEQRVRRTGTRVFRSKEKEPARAGSHHGMYGGTFRARLSSNRRKM